MKRAIFGLLLFPFLATASAQIDSTFFLSAESLEKRERIFIDQNWKYHPGDNPEWRNPEFDDSAWETTETSLRQDNLPRSGWAGLGWFRIHLTVFAIRYANYSTAIFHRAGQEAGFYFFLDSRTTLCKPSARACRRFCFIVQRRKGWKSSR